MCQWLGPCDISQLTAPIRITAKIVMNTTKRVHGIFIILLIITVLLCWCRHYASALVNGVSVALDETAREVSERQVLPAGGLRERFEQRPITALRGSYSFFGRYPTNFKATVHSQRAGAHRARWRCQVAPKIPSGQVGVRYSWSCAL